MDTVSVIMPTFNEEKYIRESLEAVIGQNFPKDQMEIILVDGMSDDKTREIIEEYQQTSNNIKILENKRRTVNHALNIGIKAAKNEYIVRVDAHSKIEKDYVSVCVETLKKTGAFSVGGPMIVEGKTKKQKIIAAAYSSRFALGGSQHYEEGYEGEANTVEWGSFRRENLIKIGMYDENLSRSEDEDLSCRILENGGKIYITPKAKYVFYPKENFKALFKQYFNYGLWKPVVIQKHERLEKIKYFIPMIFVLYLCFTVLFCGVKIFNARFGFILYLILDAYFSFSNKKLTEIDEKLGLVWVHFVIHVAYGLGFLQHYMNKIFGRNSK